METRTPTLDEAAALALQLPAADRVRLIERLADSLFGEWVARRDEPARSLRGALAHLGPAPSADDIDEMRREAWSDSPRADVFE